MTYHRGVRRQHGTGIASIFGSLFRALRPIAKGATKTFITSAKTAAKSSAGQKIKKNLKDAAINMAIDSIQGKDVKTSAKTHLKNATKDILEASKQSKKPIKRKANIKHKARKNFKKQNYTSKLYDDDYE